MKILISAVVASLCWLPGAALAFDYTEGLDLSSNELAPTPLALQLGINHLEGSVTTSTGDTRDYITFSIPSSMQLMALRLIRYEQPGGVLGNRGFHSINAGATSVIPSAGNEATLLGGAHLDPAPAGTDLLPVLATGAQAGSGFQRPLGHGTYTYLIQQTGPQISEYELEFVVAPIVPATPPWALLAGALGLLGSCAFLLRRRTWQFSTPV